MSNLAEQTLNDDFWSALPELPKAIRYYDQFADQDYTIQSPEREDLWFMYIDGHKSKVDFGRFPEELRLLIKHWFIDILSRRSPVTAVMYFDGLRKVPTSGLHELLRTEPATLRAFWSELRAEGLAFTDFLATKSRRRASPKTAGDSPGITDPSLTCRSSRPR